MSKTSHRSETHALIQVSIVLEIFFATHAVLKMGSVMSLGYFPVLNSVRIHTIDV